MSRGHAKTSVAAQHLTRDLLDRIRRAEWQEKRKKQKRAETYRPAFGSSWAQIVRVMR